MTEQELLNKNSNMLGKLCKLIAEIEYCQLNHETKQFKANINKLKQQLVHYFVPNEKQLEIFEAMIKFGAEIITYFILNAIVANLSKTNVFGTIEKSFKNAARNLTQTTHHLSHVKAVKAVKFGFMIATHKKNDCSFGIQTWSNHFTYYLENNLQFNPAKAMEIKNATEIVASKLGIIYLLQQTNLTSQAPKVNASDKISNRFFILVSTGKIVPHWLSVGHSLIRYNQRLNLVILVKYHRLN